MEYKKTAEKVLKNKYLLIVLFIGILMMVVPNFSKDNNESEAVFASSGGVDERKLEKILCEIPGIETADVFITYRDNGSIEYAYDVNRNSNQSDLEIKISDKKPVISKKLNPEIEGVLVVIKGDNIDEFKLYRTVKAATGAPLHRICIMF